jgi:predicted chitinase
MDSKTLHKLTTQIGLDRCAQLLPGLYRAFELAELNTAQRRAMWFSQVLEESVGLSATTEFATASSTRDVATSETPNPATAHGSRGAGSSN